MNDPVDPDDTAAEGDVWWPDGLGSPSLKGSDGALRYACFPEANRIAFDPGNGAPVILLDTMNNAVEGFSQHPNAGDPFGGLTFASQYGQFPLSSLPRVGDAFTQNQPAEPEPTAPYQPLPEGEATAPPAANTSPPEGDVLSTIERLAKLRDAGALTEEEFAAKKADLLARL